LDANCVVQDPSEPVPRPIFPAPRSARRRPVGEVRLPLAGPYHPRARLYRLPDGRLLWYVRLWDVDRVVLRVVSTSTLLRFARQNRLPALENEISSLVDRAVTRRRK
jgi:hypothetical protein